MAEGAIEERFATIFAMRARIEELQPDSPAVGAWGPTWTAAELDGFERAHGCTLPAGYRRFLERIGDGGPAPGLGLVALRSRGADELARLRRRFPLETGWVTPAIHDELEAEGLLPDYEAYLYPLPEGAEADDGTLVLGATSDHRAMLLVVNGPGAGQIWFDNRGNDFEEVLPSGQSFVDMVADYFANALAEAEARAHFEALVERGDYGALLETLGKEAVDARFAEIFAAHLCPEPPPPLNAALAQLMAEHYGDSYGTAAQALAMGGCWQELETRCTRDWEAFLAGELEPEFRAEATVQTHLAVAQAALGRPGPVHRYAETGGYWHRSTAIMPLLLSRWTDDSAVGAVFERLRSDVAVEFLARFPAAALATRVPWVREQGERFLDDLATKAYPTAARNSMGGPVSTVLEKLLGLFDEDLHGLTDALHTWFWLAGCAVSTKSYAKLIEMAGEQFTPRYLSRDEARTALESRTS